MNASTTVPPLPAGTWERLDGNRLQWISDPAGWGTRELLRLTAGRHPDTGTHFVLIEVAATEDLDPGDAEAVNDEFEHSVPRRPPRGGAALPAQGTRRRHRRPGRPDHGRDRRVHRQPSRRAEAVLTESRAASRSPSREAATQPPEG
jgi:hypothetical protein